MHREKQDRNKIVTVPNVLSFFRLCLVPLILWLYCVKGRYGWTAVVLLVSGVTDMIDGFIARHFGMVSELGKVLDPVADKFTQGMTLFALATRFPYMLIPPLLMAVKELVMVVTGVWAKRKTGEFHGAEWHGKVATVLLYAMILLHVIWYDIPKNVSIVTVLVCVGMMLLSFALYGVRNIRLIQKNN